MWVLGYTVERIAARTRAREANEALAKGSVWGPVHGVPITVKESYDVENVLTTIGGLLPLSLFGGALWAPMTNGMIFGLIVSTGLTLFVDSIA